MANHKTGLPRWVTVILGIIGAVVVLILVAIFALRQFQSEPHSVGDTELRFTAVDLPFTNVPDLEASLPFLGSAAFDRDGDGLDELFLGGGKLQSDAILAFRNTQFETVQELTKTQADATHGVVSHDLDDDGDVDLLIARESGVWRYDNIDGEYVGRNLNLPLADNTTPLSLALGDVNRDGQVDLFVSGYIKIGLVEGETIFGDGYGGFSNLFFGQADGTFRDVTGAAGMGRQHNSFTAVFIDLDDDRDSDLVVAQDTGVIEIWENQTAQGAEMPTFAPVPNPSVSSYPMGLAIGDYNGDGRPDIAASNVGPVFPDTLMRGNLAQDAPYNRDWYLLRNEGDLRFTDQAEAMGSDVLGFGWGVMFADMNLDGRPDLLGAQNYARLPLNGVIRTYPGKLMENRGDRFVAVEQASGASNPYFGISPLVADFDGNGAPDLVWANLGGPSQALMSGPPLGNWIAVRLPARTEMLGAKVTVRTEVGEQSQWVMTSQGMSSDSSRELIFGLGEAQTLQDITITLQDGRVIGGDDVAINSRWSVSP